MKLYLTTLKPKETFNPESVEDYPFEDMWVEEDWPKSYFEYLSENSSWNIKDISEYNCVVSWGEYIRVKFKRLYCSHYITVDTLEDLEKLLKEENFSEIWSANGVIMFGQRGD